MDDHVTYIVYYRVRNDPQLYSTYFDHLPNTRGLTTTFWKWVRTNTILSEMDVTLWSVEKETIDNE